MKDLKFFHFKKERWIHLVIPNEDVDIKLDLGKMTEEGYILKRYDY